MKDQNGRSSLVNCVAIFLLLLFFIPASALALEVIVDNDDPGTSFGGGQWGYSSGANPYDGSSRAENRSGAIYTFDSQAKGYLTVSLWWTYWRSRCQAVPVEIYDGETLLDTVEVDQQQQSLAGQWNVLGAHSFTDGARVVVRAKDGCSACADAVRFYSAVEPDLDYIQISGPAAVNENSSVEYTCTAYYTDGSSREVEPEWSEDSGYADISSTGMLTTGDVASSENCTITASYEEGGIVRAADFDIVIEDYVAPTELIVDNGDPGTSSTGTWSESGGVPPVGDDNLFSKTPGSIYRYAASLEGYYEVYLYWTDWSSRCSSVPVRIYDGNQLVHSTTVDQRQNGGNWNILGPTGYQFTGTARVEIEATSTSCSTCADAVKFVSSAAPELDYIQISGPAEVNENSSVDYTCTAYYTDGSSREVEPEWSEDSGYADISATGMLTTGDVASSEDCTITANYEEGGIAKVDDYAILIEDFLAPVEVILDNDAPGTSYAGGQWGYSSGANPYGGSSRAESQSGATYTFQQALRGDHTLSMWWTYWSSRCSAVPVDIYDGTTLLDTKYVNQRQSSLAGQWNVLGLYTFNGTARVVVHGQAGCSACADAVKFESAGLILVSVPDCVDMPQTSAATLIESAGLVAGSVSTEHHATIAAGNVISTAPASGTEVPAGSTVDLVVSLGPVPVPVSVPPCAGLTLAAAQAAINDAGLAVGTVTERHDDTVAAGIVLDENPDAGTLVALSTPVDLVVSLGPSPVLVSVPLCTGLIQTEAELAITMAGLTVGAVTLHHSDTVLTGNVISTTPAGGTEVPLGSAVDLVVSDGSAPVTVPDVVGLPSAAAQAAITSAGFAVGNIAYRYSSNVAPGNVIIQSHTAGSQLLEGSPVDLVICQAAAVVDNGEPGATIAYGKWLPSSGPRPYGGGSLYVSDDGTATYTWLFSPTSSGYYNVSMWWTTLPSRGISIPVDIEYFDDTTTAYINQQQNGGQWNSLGSYYYEAGNTYEVTLRAVGGGASNCADAVRFAKENILRHKFTVDLPGGEQMMPVMGDIDDDGTQEIVVVAGYYVVAIDGETGEIEWSVSGAAYTAPELVDLDNDGIPEILHGMHNSTGPRLRALNGDGTVRWTSAYLPGEEMSLFPIVAYDIDGDGFPTIFFTTQDYTPEPFSGKISDYNGALVKLNHNGVVLDTTWILKPCWGGAAIADANFDGSFEVYVGDRREGYMNLPGNGVQAFDAETLDLIWERPDIQHSSPLPILADVTGDSDLEVVASKITLAGPMVLNAETGATISDYSNMRLPTHGTPTVYDIDEDGNLEVIYSTSYPDRAPSNFVVFDLVTGEVDFEASFDFWITWPPKVGDVTGDGHMEIIVATGSQEDAVGDTHNGNYPILVYDKEFKLIDIVELDINAGQLTPARVYDTDNDGYNEVVVPGFNNKIMVYDTSAATPDPAPNTWVQFYSVYRQGVPEFVAPPLALPSARLMAPVKSDSNEIVDNHAEVPFTEEPIDAKGYSGFE